MIVHAGLVAQRLGGRWRGVLIRGPSGVGKSDLALRALDAGFRLVADDRVVLWASEGRLFGRAPAPLRCLMELRGYDVAPTPAIDFSEVALVLDPGAAERIPTPDWAELTGVRAPRLTLPYREASAPAKLGRALAALYLDGQRRM